VYCIVVSVSETTIKNDISVSLAFALYGYEVDVIGEFLTVERLFVVVHDVGQIGVAANLGQYALFLGLFEVVLGAVVLVLREDLLLD
jgi:hypothetical protein